MKLRVAVKVITKGLRFHVGMSVAFGLIWTSAALGNHGLTFATPVNYAADDAPSSVAIGDLDGDEVPDLAVANLNTDNVSVLLGVGDGTFAAPVHYPAVDGPVLPLLASLLTLSQFPR